MPSPTQESHLFWRVFDAIKAHRSPPAFSPHLGSVDLPWRNQASLHYTHTHIVDRPCIERPPKMALMPWECPDLWCQASRANFLDTRPLPLTASGLGLNIEESISATLIGLKCSDEPTPRKHMARGVDGKRGGHWSQIFQHSRDSRVSSVSPLRAWLVIPHLKISIRHGWTQCIMERWNPGWSHRHWWLPHISELQIFWGFKPPREWGNLGMNRLLGQNGHGQIIFFHQSFCEAFRVSSSRGVGTGVHWLFPSTWLTLGYI